MADFPNGFDDAVIGLAVQVRGNTPLTVYNYSKLCDILVEEYGHTPNSADVYVREQISTLPLILVVQYLES